jgi:hypothetical protein
MQDARPKHAIWDELPAVTVVRMAAEISASHHLQKRGASNRAFFLEGIPAARRF